MDRSKCQRSTYPVRESLVPTLLDLCLEDVVVGVVVFDEEELGAGFGYWDGRRWRFAVGRPTKEGVSKLFSLV